MSEYFVAVDVGGTFCDVVLQDVSTGRTWAAKVPATPREPAVGFGDAVRRVLDLAGASAHEITRVFHGTTIATNAVIERAPVKMGLVTTKGFKYVLEIGRHDIPRRQNMFAWEKPARPVTPNLIFEATERLDHEGEVLIPLDEDECREVARRLRDAGVESVAVCLLYSYANPVHERRVLEILRRELPGTPNSLSSEVLSQGVVPIPRV